MESKFLYIFGFCVLLIVSCAKQSSTNPSYYALIENIVEDGDCTVTEWNNYKCFVMPSEDYKHEVLIIDKCDEQVQKDIYNKLLEDLGQPFADKETHRKGYEPTCYNIAVFHCARIGFGYGSSEPPLSFISPD